MESVVESTAVAVSDFDAELALVIELSAVSFLTVLTAVLVSDCAVELVAVDVTLLGAVDELAEAAD
ncbi:hypothetical protein [Furfurilactobacillus cerevisiae]